MSTNRLLISLALILACPALARAQFAIPWFTIDGGGGTSAGGIFSLSGTIGQCDAGPNSSMTGGTFSLDGGFWPGVAGDASPACYPDCDGDAFLSIDDFICFQTFFALGDPYADCDGDSALSIDDFICFQTFFAVGC